MCPGDYFETIIRRGIQCERYLDLAAEDEVDAGEKKDFRGSAAASAAARGYEKRINRDSVTTTFNIAAAPLYFTLDLSSLQPPSRLRPSVRCVSYISHLIARREIAGMSGTR